MPTTEPRDTIHCVGWGGSTRALSADFELGMAHERPMGDYGLRRALWDIAFGYVSGFRIRDIAWFVMSRSLHQRIEAHALRREGYEVIHGVPRVCALGPRRRGPGMTPERPTCPLCGSEYSSWTAALSCEIEDLDTRGQQ